MASHFVQTTAWCEFKNKYGTSCVSAGGVFYTKHKIPLVPFFVAYCPRVDPHVIDFAHLQKSLMENKCIYINFDVPNILKNTSEEKNSIELFESHSCIKSKRTTFATANILLDLTLDESALLNKMHPKRRYNIKLAQKNGVNVREGEFEEYWKLAVETANLQKFFLHPKSYYQLIWEILGSKGAGVAHILTAYHENTALASWMLFVHDKTIYYPYGGSSAISGKYHASELLGWEAIKFGKRLGCTKFDMWGAADSLEDESNSYFGFTQFKIRFGGEHVVYMDSYDFVLNKTLYLIFNTINKLRWIFLRLLK